MIEPKVLTDIEDEADENSVSLKTHCNQCGVLFYTKIPSRIFCDACTAKKIRGELI